jgi:hypothetical protein
MYYASQNTKFFISMTYFLFSLLSLLYPIEAETTTKNSKKSLKIPNGLRRGVVYTLDCFLMPLPRSRFSSAYVACPFVFFSFGHCVICSSLIYGF